MDIVTNNIPRNLIDAYQLSDKAREEFDYLDWEKIDNGEDSATFFRYKGRLYDLGEFVRTPESLKPWDGMAYDTVFSGVLIRLVDDDQIIVGQYFS